MDDLFENNDFMHFAYIGNVHKVLFLIENNQYNVNTTNSKNRTALHYAALEGNVEVVNALIRAGADVTAVDCLNRTPLHSAVLSRSEIVRNMNTLTHRTGDTNVRNLTVEHFEREKIKAILNELIISGNQTLDEECITVLRNAEYGRHVDTVEALIKAGAKVNALDDRGKTPLHVAAIECNPLVVKILLTRGADYLSSDNFDNTPSDEAEHYNNHETFNSILRDFTEEQDNIDEDNYY